MGALKRFVEKHFEMPTQAIQNDVLTVVGIVQAAPNNPDRLSLTMMNLSGTDMYVSPDTVPSATHGILLQSGGGVVSLNAAIDGELVGYEWSVYCTVANEELYVLETEGAG